jgi:hypothetical protein
MKQGDVTRFGGVTLYTGCLPVVVARYDDGQTGADIAAMGAEIVRLSKDHRLIGMIHDASGLSRVMGAADRKHMREAVEGLIPVMDAKAAGSAVIITNPLIRGAMTAAKWFMPHKFEERLFATPREGADWLVTRFRDVGAPLPASTVVRLLAVADARFAA